jgi:uncharacterized membrane protein YbhN (UPF0104 family)
MVEVPEPVVDPEIEGSRQSRRLRNAIISLALLMLLVVSLLIAVPSLHGVAHRLDEMPAWAIVAAIALKVLSCIGFIVTFWCLFGELPFMVAWRVGWTMLAFNSTVSVGGAGSVAVGAWLLTSRGMPAPSVAERSAVLFFLTSAINVVAFIVFGALAALGLGGPTNPLLSILPAAMGVLILVFFLALPRIAERVAGEGRFGALLRGLAKSIRDTARALVTPDLRLLGAVAYLAFDIAVLWVCFLATGHSPPISALVLAYQIGYLANAIPVPGGIGVLDGGLVGMLILYGANATTAAAAVIFYHAIALWVPALIGTIAFIRLQRATRGTVRVA